MLCALSIVPQKPAQALVASTRYAFEVIRCNHLTGLTRTDLVAPSLKTPRDEVMSHHARDLSGLNLGRRAWVHTS
jgi:hypothetical protein